MKKAKLLRPEFIVIGLIMVFLAAASLLVNVPQTQQQTSSLPNLGKAPELAGISGWINSPPLNISGLKGKVVLTDFWTYTCINCIRTLPYLNSWHEKYHDKGLVIIGVHTPEFEFEKNYNNVKVAVDQYGIKYAVAQDNDYATWRAFNNKYWPRKYLIDKDGNIRYDHIGEGGYAETEEAIQQLLREINPLLSENMTNITVSTDFSGIATPELYLGYEFARAPLGNAEGFSPGNVVNYVPTNITSGNVIYLSGKWKNEADYIEAVENANLFLVYKAKNVNIVAGGNSSINILVDDRPANGTDLANGAMVIDEYKLYNIIAGSNYNTHVLEIDASPGFRLYTFTFG